MKKKIPKKICKHSMQRLNKKTREYICIFCGQKRAAKLVDGVYT
jgi:hypothetical protein